MASATQARRIVVAAAIGNGLIMYDFTVYSFAAVTIGRLFFPSSSAIASLLMSFATFGAGFLMRPLGALIVGTIADHRGRRAGLTFSIALMTVGTALIAFTPGYASIGMAAPLLILLARLMQGLAAGGEIGTASAVLLEMSSANHRCYLVSWRAASQGISALAGALVVALLTALLPPDAMQQWGWRIPFVLGMLIGPVGWYLRRHMAPTQQEQHRPPLEDLFAQHPRTLWYGLLMMAAPSASIYITVFYMPTYLITTLHLPPVISLLSACVAGSVIFIATPLVARVADRQPRRKTIQYAALISSITLVFPAFLALSRGVGEAASLLIIGGYAAVALSNGGAFSVMLMEAFPRHQRATGMSMVYSLGTTLFGGFSPFIVTWLIGATGNPLMPAWYLLAMLCLSLFALTRFPARIEPI